MQHIKTKIEQLERAQAEVEKLKREIMEEVRVLFGSTPAPVPPPQQSTNGGDSAPPKRRAPGRAHRSTKKAPAVRRLGPGEPISDLEFDQVMTMRRDGPVGLRDIAKKLGIPLNRISYIVYQLAPLRARARAKESLETAQARADT